MSASIALLAWLGASAMADIAPRPPEGERFVVHKLELKGLPEGRVLVVVDDGDTVSRVISIDADGTRQLASGRERGGRLGAPGLWSMSTTDLAAWKAKADAEVAKQKAACREGRGCAHISRFVPDIPAPSPRVDCHIRLELHTHGPASGPDTWTDTVEVVEMTDERCVLTLTPPSTPSQCSTGLVGTSAVSLLLGMGLVVASRRRQG